VDGQSGIARIKPVAGFAQGLGEVFDAAVRLVRRALAASLWEV
jgi:phage shock protein PspC (stress-responsive transcriptional regulator)